MMFFSDARGFGADGGKQIVPFVPAFLCWSQGVEGVVAGLRQDNTEGISLVSWIFGRRGAQARMGRTKTTGPGCEVQRLHLWFWP